MARKCLVLLFVFVLIAGFSAFAGPQPETAAETERPNWLWGLPWGSAGTFTEESLELANKWAIEKFGGTFKLSLPGGEVDVVTALNRLIAEGGDFPDAVCFGYKSYDDVQIQKIIVDMAKFGKSMPLNKWFNDPENYPNLKKVTAVEDQMYGLTWQGKLYAHPAMGVYLADSPASSGIEWFMRWDALIEFGGNTIEEQKYVPTSLDELYDFLKQVDQLGLTDKEDKPSYGFSMGFGRNSPSEWRRVLYTMKGAGWEVDDQKRLLPQWASEETYEALKYVNMLYREGLMHPNFDILDSGAWMQSRRWARPIVNAGMENFNPDVRQPLVREYGSIEAASKDIHWNTFYMNVIPPIVEADGKIGAYTDRMPGAGIVMKTMPNPAAYFKMLDWLLTPEGYITYREGEGPMGIVWEFPPEADAKKFDPPLPWRLIGYETMMPMKEDGSVDWDKKALIKSACPDKHDRANDYDMDAEFAKGCPPRLLPQIHFFMSPLYFHYAEMGAWGSWITRREVGMPYDGREGTWTAAVGDLQLHQLIKEKITQPRPSYKLVLYDFSPLEAGAFATAEQRFDESLSAILTAKTAAEFEKNYQSTLSSLSRITNWKPVYEKKQAAWEDWMKKNSIDDRRSLRTVTPRPEWKEVMDW